MSHRTIITLLLTGICHANPHFQAAKPVLEQHCVSCHNADKTKGGLRLDTHAGFLEGGDDELAYNPNSPRDSHLLKLVKLPHDHDDIMPPKGRPLQPEEIKALEAWLAASAPWPKDTTLVAQKPQPTLAELTAGLKQLVPHPSSIRLETASDFHSVIAYAHYADATKRDVTRQLTFSLADPSIAKIESNKLLPLKDGKTTLTLTLGSHSAQIPVTVSQASTKRPVSFQLDVMPVITAAGCNTGSCHGAARGQDGFQLSLFGFDPKGDYQRMTREFPGRRINLALPEDSLFLTKAAGQVPHTGGKILTPETPGYQTLLEWIKAGAHYDKDDIPHPTSIDIQPREIVTKGAEIDSTFTVTAHYSDGTDRDVTPLSTFTSSNDNALAIDDKTKVATSANRGEAFIMARFHTFTQGSQAIVIPKNDQHQAQANHSGNFIDQHIGAKLNKLRITPSDLCSDEVFLRRVYIDIIGKIPSPEQHAHFLADTAPDKREKLIDHLLAQPEFNDIWVMKWAELLQIRTFNNTVSYKAAILYHTWLREQFAANRPFNLIVKDIISARGGTFSTPQTNFYQVERDNLKLSENVAQVFMGTRLQCAQCHNHPFDQWTMEDYYGFAAFFSEVKRKKAEDPREQIIFDGKGDVKHPVTNQAVAPKFLGGSPPPDDGKKRREHIADWLTAPENPWFAKNVSNIIWEHFLGRGIVHPVDDVRISNPPSNPALLEALSSRFVDYNYDFKKLVRDICNSHAYQRSTHTNLSNVSDHTNFSHAIPRRMRAEVLLDVISQATETPNKFKGLPRGAKAVSIADGNTSTYFLRTFGRSTRQTVCSCEVKLEPNLSQALHLLNGDSTNNRIPQGKVVSKLIDSKASDEELIRQLYLRCLSRPPVAKETQHLLAFFKDVNDPKTRKEIHQDIFWSLLNSKEFIFNH
ncbi:PSD1 and planctomycete cytochrome C domain-containing protein [Rubritalea tangerina]|uniref:PSD1 and planctomycete cytochrome C domain-containing protein n=2 Tax=Rubritalea tangerina TaxID=430798 RepID=A0ABW4ZD34_9BACT